MNIQDGSASFKVQKVCKEDTVDAKLSTIKTDIQNLNNNLQNVSNKVNGLNSIVNVPINTSNSCFYDVSCKKCGHVCVVGFRYDYTRKYNRTISGFPKPLLPVWIRSGSMTSDSDTVINVSPNCANLNTNGVLSTINWSSDMPYTTFTYLTAD